MKIYRLLRSNKESGPYSAEELVAMGLKPYDLLWADGRSAAWRYPSEIEALRAFAPAVEEQPYDRFYKKSKLTDTVKSNVSEESIVETIAVSIEKKQKPKIKITADWSKVETKKAAIPVHEIIEKKIITDRKVSWENAWLNWEQEKKTATEVSKIPLGKYVAEKKEDAVLETKFSASLDDIKSQYIENILHSKKKTENFNIPVSPKYIMAAALC